MISTTQQQKGKSNKRLVTSRSVFTITLIVAVLTILGIWLFGLGQHRTIFVNSILSTSILSLAFFLFLSIGLYKGVKLKDDLGKITDNLKPAKIPDLSGVEVTGDFIQLGEGLEGVILSIFVWIVITLLIGLFLWLFGAFLWSGIIIFIAMLYWIFFRALRLVFKNSNRCKDSLMVSLIYGLAYTLLYNFWIYGIILSAHYLVK